MDEEEQEYLETGKFMEQMRQRLARVGEGLERIRESAEHLGALGRVIVERSKGQTDKIR